MAPSSWKQSAVTGVVSRKRSMMLTVRQSVSKEYPISWCTGMSQLISRQRASAVTCADRSGMSGPGRAGPGRAEPRSPRSPHLRLPGERLPRLEVALQLLAGQVPALPVLAEGLQLHEALRARLLLLRLLPPPPLRERRALRWPGAALQPRRAEPPPVARRRHHGSRASRTGSVRVAALRRRYLSAGGRRAEGGRQQEIDLQNKIQNTVEEEPGRRSSLRLRTASK